MIFFLVVIIIIAFMIYTSKRRQKYYWIGWLQSRQHTQFSPIFSLPMWTVWVRSYFFHLYKNCNEFNWRKNRFMWNISRLSKYWKIRQFHFIVHVTHEFAFQVLPFYIELNAWYASQNINKINIYYYRQATNNILIDFHWI